MGEQEKMYLFSLIYKSIKKLFIERHICLMKNCTILISIYRQQSKSSRTNDVTDTMGGTEMVSVTSATNVE